MNKAVFDLCCFDEVALDYVSTEITEIIAARLDIEIGHRSMLVVDVMKKVDMVINSGKKVKMVHFNNKKVKMHVANGSKSSMKVGLLGGGS